MIEMVQEQFIKDHQWATEVTEAHPIDRDIIERVCDTKMGPILIQYDLALIQAVAQSVLDSRDDLATLVTDRSGNEYYCGTSNTFYTILACAHELYSGYVEAEHVEDIIEVHTRQYLRDLYGYDGDFGGQVANDSIDRVHDPTLCNAMNEDGSVVPDYGAYGFVDSRGLVVQQNSHE